MIDAHTERLGIYEREQAKEAQRQERVDELTAPLHAKNEILVKHKIFLLEHVEKHRDELGSACSEALSGYIVDAITDAICEVQSDIFKIEEDEY